MKASCELVNTYQVLEHVMGINGLHPHRLDTIREMRLKLIQHVSSHAGLSDGVVLDIGCGSGAGTNDLAGMAGAGQYVIGIDIDSTAIRNARKQYGNIRNLSFFQGDLASFLVAHPHTRISAAICISVSMFIQDVGDFYKQVHGALLPGGMFIDAPFLFNDLEMDVAEDFRLDTYAVCGCNMKMFQVRQLRGKLLEAGFSVIDCVEHDFDLMKLRVLFDDYPAHYLVRNFLKNVLSPPPHFRGISSRYLFLRTLKIFYFFLKHRHKYASGELVVLKAAPH